ncbi:Fur family transcriptional regulator [Pectinatus brassicae]|uniref:Fur family ferric uptake transcriptional regulator n=1 Tax=Pectinatus brassicae TaxID=862415 RepID=A0A840UGE3_9FIRM|nr:Fur family transcriptional regulator [Pectinatus brassicae]MBB5336079.1 Fur family ferric uptake transcriptional regulator [Pectinatus brassicae]
MSKIDYKKYLNKYGIKSTKQRNLLLNILKDSMAAQSAENIYLEAKKSDKIINLSTVYRILEKFTEKNIITKTVMNDKMAAYSLTPQLHQHQLICLRCKKMILLDECPLHEFEKNVEKTTEFSVTDHRLELYGYCRECQKIINKPK